MPRTFSIKHLLLLAIPIALCVSLLSERIRRQQEIDSMGGKKISYEIVAVRAINTRDLVALVQFYIMEDRTREESFVASRVEDVEYDYLGETIEYAVNVPILDTRTLAYSVNVPVHGVQEIIVPRGSTPDDVVREFMSNEDHFVECNSCSMTFIEKPDVCSRCKESFEQNPGAG